MLRYSFFFSENVRPVARLSDTNHEERSTARGFTILNLGGVPR